MTLVNPETGEIVERPTYSEVRDSIATAREAGVRFFEQIVWQVERRAWEVLGYSDWDEMREAEYADMGVVVPRADRPEIVTRLRAAGLMQQEIADTLGVGQSTVQRDLNTHLGNGPASTIETSRGPRPSSYTTKTPEPAATPDTDLVEAPEPRSAGVVDAPPAPVDCQRPVVESFVDADRTVQVARWQKNFMDAIAKSIQIITFAPEDVAANAGPELIAEYERLIRDLSNHLARVRGEKPNRLTAIKGGAQ